jgi:hypothetical protein
MAPVTRNVKTTQDEIVVDWVALNSPENGDSQVTSYNLQWYYNNLWTDLYGVLPSAVLTQFILTSNIVRGQTYQFRIRAENNFGWGPFSTVTNIKAAGIPY